jgi:hypothetical protein
LIFLEGIPGGERPVWKNRSKARAVHAVHWYDILTLMLKKYRSWIAVHWETLKMIFTKPLIQRSIRLQYQALKNVSRDQMDNIPTLVGEFGIPFDLENQKAYKAGDYSSHVKALSSYYRAMDELQLSCTLWNYTADNTNEFGDGWNEEDLSIFSRDQRVSQDLDSGGRAILGYARPYAWKTSGKVKRFSYDWKKQRLKMSYVPDHRILEPSLIFLPGPVFNGGLNISSRGARWELEDYGDGARLLKLFHQEEANTVRLSIKLI